MFRMRPTNPPAPPTVRANNHPLGEILPYARWKRSRAAQYMRIRYVVFEETPL